MSSQIIKKQVAIIGGGPVGLVAGHLLEKAGINYAIYERNYELAQHPAAHLINLRSMEILQELDLYQNIQDQIEDSYYFKNYRYLRRILEPKDKHYAKHDHFYPNREDKRREIATQSFSTYTHLPQHKLVKILYETLKFKEERVLFNSQVSNITNPDIKNEKADQFVQFEVVNKQTGIKEIVQSDFLIACDGFHSQIRKQQGIQMVGNDQLQSFLNICFSSKHLADLIDQQDQNAMLHFVYNSDITACLVNHTKGDGLFVLQIPIYQPFSKLVNTKDINLRDKEALEIINKLMYKGFNLSDTQVKIEHVGFWNLSCMQIETYTKNRIIFAGDSAHSFPPAGGFGMNTGIHEAHNLVHKLRSLILQKPYLQEQQQQQKEEEVNIYQHNKIKKVFTYYHREMQQYCSLVTNETMIQYRKSLQIAKKLGLSLDNLLIVKSLLSLMPFPSKVAQTIWNKAIKAGTYHLELDHTKFKRNQEELKFLKNTENLIDMIYYDQDVNFTYGNGQIDTKKRFDFPMLGRLIPHFNVQMSEQLGGQVMSTRQIANYIDDNHLILKNKENIIFQLQENNQGNEKVFYMALYFDSFWDKNQQKLAQIVKEFDFPPDFIFGLKLENQENTREFWENNNNKQKQQNVICPYNFDLNRDQLADEQIENFDQALDQKINEIFSNNKQEIILFRSDGHIFTVIEQQEIQN